MSEKAVGTPSSGDDVPMRAGDHEKHVLAADEREKCNSIQNKKIWACHLEKNAHHKICCPGRLELGNISASELSNIRLVEIKKAKIP